MSTRRSVVHSEALSQLPERGLVIHQVMRADVTVLKLIWPFCGYRERRQSRAAHSEKCNIVFQGVSPLSPLLCFGCFCVPGCVYALKICNWKMENGKQYVYMNHFTLGEKTAACEKKTTPPISSRIFPFNSFLLHSIFHFPITT